MKKCVVLPLFFFLSLSGCASNTNNQKGPMDRDQALLSLVRYRELQKAADYTAPTTLKLKTTVDEVVFHENTLHEIEIELQVDTEYVNGEKDQVFPYAHFLAKSTKDSYSYESWVFVEGRSTGNILNVYERGTEFQRYVRREYVFESKRDWNDKATDCLDVMKAQIYGTPDRLSSAIKEIAEKHTIVTENYDETSSNNLAGDIVYKTDESESNEFTFKFEDYCLKSYSHTKGKIKNETNAIWNSDIERGYPSPSDFTLEGETFTKTIR